MEDPEMISEGDETTQPGGLTAQMSGEQVQFMSGLAIRVSAEQDVTMEQAAALGVAAGRDMVLTDSLAFGVAVGRDLKASDNGLATVVAGNDVELANCGIIAMNAGGNMSLANSGVVAARASQVSAQHSSLGIVLARQVHLGEGSRVYLNTPQAVALGVAAGAAFALLSWLLKRK